MYDRYRPHISPRHHHYFRSEETLPSTVLTALESMWWGRTLYWTWKSALRHYGTCLARTVRARTLEGKSLIVESPGCLWAGTNSTPAALMPCTSPKTVLAVEEGSSPTSTFFYSQYTPPHSQGHWPYVRMLWRDVLTSRENWHFLGALLGSRSLNYWSLRASWHLHWDSSYEPESLWINYRTYILTFFRVLNFFIFLDREININPGDGGTPLNRTKLPPSPSRLVLLEFQPLLQVVDRRNACNVALNWTKESNNQHLPVSTEHSMRKKLTCMERSGANAKHDRSLLARAAYA